MAAFATRRERVELDRQVAGDRWRDPLNRDRRPVALDFPYTPGGVLREGHVNEE